MGWFVRSWIAFWNSFFLKKAHFSIRKSENGKKIQFFERKIRKMPQYSFEGPFSQYSIFPLFSYFSLALSRAPFTIDVADRKIKYFIMMDCVEIEFQLCEIDFCLNFFFARVCANKINSLNSMKCE